MISLVAPGLPAPAGKDYKPLSFATPSLYNYVRHPLYIGWFFAFWSAPTMTLAQQLAGDNPTPDLFQLAQTGSLFSLTHLYPLDSSRLTDGCSTSSVRLFELS